MGHLMQGVSTGYKRLDRNTLKHAYDVIKLFFKEPARVQPEVKIQFRGQTYPVRIHERGWIEDEITLPNQLNPGWHKFKFIIESEVVGDGIFLKPDDTALGVISDIDDTYLISHSKNTFRKLSVMLFKNITKRKPFQEAVQHYKQLYQRGCQEGNRNLFVNVTSSEWNLYPLITQFSKFNDFPNAILLMDKLKYGWRELFFSGTGNHAHKFEKIEKIIKFYPDKKFIFIGDDTQRDPWIYSAIYEQYADAVSEVQIRQSGKKKKKTVEDLLKEIPGSIYFENSTDLLS